jgi:lysozyme
MTPQFVDISAFQGNIDFVAYRKWAASFDGIARIAIKATEGTGFIDPNFATNRAKALSAGIDVLLLYHFARPDLGNNASAEANFMHSTIGNVRDSDLIVLDYEVSSPQATGAWAYAWLSQQEANYGKLPGIYAASAYIQQRLNDPRLTKYPLWLANWQFSPDARPPVPPPWTSYEFVQFTDNGVNIPGINSTVDVNIYLGKEEIPSMTTIPTGWTDDGVTLKGPDGTPVSLGFRQHILADPNWDPANVPLEAEHHDLIIEQSNASLGAGQSQMFRWKRLEYTQKMGVFEGWLGQELLWYQKQYQALLQKIADLQQQLNADQSQVATLQAEIDKLNALLDASNLSKINALAQQIVDLSHVQ